MSSKLARSRTSFFLFLKKKKERSKERKRKNFTRKLVKFFRNFFFLKRKRSKKKKNFTRKLVKFFEYIIVLLVLWYVVKRANNFAPRFARRKVVWDTSSRKRVDVLSKDNTSTYIIVLLVLKRVDVLSKDNTSTRSLLPYGK